MIIIMAIFAQRQILRLRNNSARQRPNVSLKPLAKKPTLGIEQKLTAVETMRKSYLPRLTDCTMIGQHSNAPYIHRMIAVDEISLEIGESFLLLVVIAPCGVLFVFFAYIFNNATTAQIAGINAVAG
ncbi:hypothetical protein ANCDUO_23883, partial [Ancylostoma duodenale]